jgi:predicted ferric reductase
MNNELLQRFDRGAHPGQRTEPDRQRRIAPVIVSHPRSTAYRIAKSGTAWTVRAVGLAILALITWLWLRDGGISGVHNLGTFFTSVGRITGLFGAYLLLVQVLLLARLPVLEWVIGFDRLAVLHRLNGKICLYLILAHVVFITVGYGLMDRISIPAEFWTFLTIYPGMVTALIGTVLLILVVATSIVIVRRRLRYETWFLVHLMAYAGIVLSWFHQLPTGNEFVTNRQAAAFWTALYVATLLLVVLFRIVQPIARHSWHRLRVAEVIEEGPGVISLRITGHHLRSLHAHAGQFFLWRFLDRGRWTEAHPFSLSAAPDGESLRITVKSLGDFTSGLRDIKPGTPVIAEGPFGTFTEEARTRDRVALIAGGIGITPVRALLEEMSGAERGSMTGRIALVYRVVREEELVFRQELEALARERDIIIHFVLGDHRTPGNERLMSADHLRELIPNIASREIYLCGPRAMMRTVEKSVRRLGIPSRYIHKDEFAL